MKTFEEKKRQRSLETEVVAVYYEGHHPKEPAPSSLAHLSLEEKHQRIEQLLHLDQKPIQEIKGQIQWHNGPVFATPEYNPIQNRCLGNLQVTQLLEDIITYHRCTGSVAGNRFTLHDYGDCLHFYLTWPKGDGSDYVIFDLEQHEEPEIRQRIQQLQHLSTWAHGSLKKAYRTRCCVA
ncbi:MAG: hypothetical protein AABX13_03215 [Nanoarchaeota archaeon]